MRKDLQGRKLASKDTSPLDSQAGFAPVPPEGFPNIERLYHFGDTENLESSQASKRLTKYANRDDVLLARPFGLIAKCPNRFPDVKEKIRSVILQITHHEGKIKVFPPHIQQGTGSSLNALPAPSFLVLGLSPSEVSALTLRKVWVDNAGDFALHTFRYDTRTSPSLVVSIWDLEEADERITRRIFCQALLKPEHRSTLLKAMGFETIAQDSTTSTKDKDLDMSYTDDLDLDSDTSDDKYEVQGDDDDPLVILAQSTQVEEIPYKDC